MAQLCCLLVLHGDTTYPEGAPIYEMLRSLHSGHLYADPYQFPYNEQLYGPIFYALGAVVAKLGSGSAMFTAVVLRTISLLSFVASILLIARLTWKLERNHLLTVASVFLGLGCVWAVPFSASARPDGLAILLVLGSLSVYEEAETNFRLLFLAGVFAAMACLTKQTMALTALAPVLDALLRARFRASTAFLTGALGFPALVFGLLWLRHEPFAANFAVARHSIVKSSTVLPAVLLMLKLDEMSLVLIAIAGIGLAFSWRLPRYRLYLLVSALGIISNVLALANTGSSNNYLILPWMLLVLWVPTGLRGIHRMFKGSPVVSIAFAAVGTLLLVHQRNILGVSGSRNLDNSSLANVEMLSDRPYLEAGSRNPQLLDPFFYHQLSLQHLWSIDPVLARIDGQMFDLIAIHGQRAVSAPVFEIDHTNGMSVWGPEVVDAIHRHYRALCAVSNEMMFVPDGKFSRIDAAQMQAVFGEPCFPTEDKLQVEQGSR